MSIKSELTKTASYLRSARQAILGRGGEISATAGLKDLSDAINSIPSGGGSSDNSILAKVVDGSITELTEKDLEGATQIRARAFQGCGNLISAEIPRSVLSFGSYMFHECGSLERICLKDMSVWCEHEFNMSDSPTKNGVDLYLNNELLTDLSVPDTVTSIGNYAFYKYTKLVNVTIADSVTEIKSYAFSGCENVVKVTMPSRLERIGNSAFASCKGCLEYDFSRATRVPSLFALNVFTTRNANVVFKVPSALYDEWITTTNWTSVAENTVAV